MEATNRFHSCFAVDASKASEAEAVITDSTNRRWHVDLSDPAAKADFKKWLAGVFLRGVAQTLTVFEYAQRGEGHDAEYWVTRFFLPKQAMLSEDAG